jgi:hypothetical protein
MVRDVCAVNVQKIATDGTAFALWYPEQLAKPGDYTHHHHWGRCLGSGLVLNLLKVALQRWVLGYELGNVL